LNITDRPVEQTGGQTQVPQFFFREFGTGIFQPVQHQRIEFRFRGNGSRDLSQENVFQEEFDVVRVELDAGKFHVTIHPFQSGR